MNYQFVNQEKKEGLLYLFTLFGYFLISFIISLIITLFSIGGILRVVLSSLCPPLAFILTGLIYKNESKKVLLSLKTKVRKINFLFVILIAVAMLFAFGYINILFGDFLNKIGIKSQSSNISINDFSDYLILCFFVGIVPAVFEEFFFRGLLLNSLESFGKYFAVIISALFFSLYHGSVSMLLYQFLYGLILGLVAVKTRGIACGVIIHFLNNFIVLTFEYFNLILIDKWYLIITGFILLIVGVFGIIKYNMKVLNEGNRNKKDFFFPFGIFALIISVLTIVLGVVL